MERAIKGVFIGVSFFMVMMGFAGGEEREVVTYVKDVKSIVSKGCLSCHGSDAPTVEEFKKNKEGFKQRDKGPRMDTYENLMIFVNGTDTGALMRRLDDGRNTKDGKPGNMYKFLGATDDERARNLEVIKKWIGGWTLKRKAEITEYELKAIKAKEK
ncbi:MAG: cytochrome C [Thermodesulfobacteriota bacterium]